MSEKEFPRESRIIANDFYVDDLITGAESVTEIEIIKNSIINIFQSVGMELRKWATNISKTADSIEFGKNENRKTLGIWWGTAEDALQYHCDSSVQLGVISKRSILSSISRLYDPLGLVGPIVVSAKIMIQSLWQQQREWDEPVPVNIKEKWLSFVKGLEYIKDIRIPRMMVIPDACHIEVHGFCDASELAYAACIYIKSVDSLGKVLVHLVCSKSRVAPLKTITLPRLELCGAALLAQLVNNTINYLDLGSKINSIFYWTDSTITLNWVRSDPSLRKTFVANRVSLIQGISNPSSWSHVRSQDNPADMLSREMSASKLVNNNLWWTGPGWLTFENDMWPTSEFSIMHELPESRVIKTLTNVAQDEEVLDIFNRYSSLKLLIRVTAYCFRFINNCKVPLPERASGILTVDELALSERALIKAIQHSYFRQELNRLEQSGSVHAKSQLLRLCPLLDENKIIRVGGRLSNTNFNYDRKHPIVLPSKHTFTRLVLQYYHETLLHCGPQALLAAVRELYWPISGRNMARKIVRQCVTCYRYAPVPITPQMGALPRSRVTPAPAFHISGVDYAGPFLINNKKGRGAQKVKAYICIFICFTTKAIHLELVSELSTDGFLLALNRFVARRGRPLEIHSDRGSNFRGAAAELGRFLEAQLSTQHLASKLVDKGISWRFIPPYSPHFGGLWEAGVKSVKGHLLKIMGNASMIFEEFYTLLAQIEAILNSRPISPLSSNPNDLEPLTRAHFLIGRSLLEVPCPDYTGLKESRMSRYQRVQQLMQHFWKRWSREYLVELQQRPKWATASNVLIKPGDLVLLQDTNLPPRHWRLGRVIENHVGDDGVVRVCTLRTSKGQTTRAVKKLCFSHMKQYIT